MDEVEIALRDGKREIELPLERFDELRNKYHAVIGGMDVWAIDQQIIPLSIRVK
jgi:hypothetical protein